MYLISVGHSPADVDAMPPDDILDIWVSMNSGFIGPHAEYIRFTNLISSIDAMNSNNIAVQTGKKANEPRKPREIFPHFFDFAELKDSDAPENKMKDMMRTIDGRL